VRLTLLVALALGAGSAALLGCGSSDNPHLLSQARADRISQSLDEVRAAVHEHNCGGVSSALRRLQSQIDTLPNDTDPGLRDRLKQGATSLEGQAVKECAQTETTPTVTETTQTETTPTETTQTETQTTQTQTTQTQTTTTPTTTTTIPTTPPTATEPGNGGATPTTP
jgi:hypothetical protein